jgi:hypothetical protein
MMPKFTVNRADGSTYEIEWPPKFHNEPYNEVRSNVRTLRPLWRL